MPADPGEVTVHDTPLTQIMVRMPIDVADVRLKKNGLRLESGREAVEL